MKPVLAFLTLLLIIFAKVITVQSFIQSCDFLIFSYNLRSFLRVVVIVVIVVVKRFCNACG